MKIVILSLAKNDLKEIHKYLSEFGQYPPENFRESFEKFCIQIKDTPYMYNQYKHNPIYRKAVITYNYLIFYQINEDDKTLKIYRVLHGRQSTDSLIK